MEYSDSDKVILWLSMALGTGSVRFFELMDYYGDIDEIWNNFNAQDQSLNFLPTKIKDALAKTRNMSYVSNCIEKWNKPKFVTILSNDYPDMLRETSNPPIILYYMGEMRSYEKCIGIVGSRRCTKYGLDCAYKFAGDLSLAGVTIVSGGARGIDSRAHEGTLDAGGRTVCVLGCGIDVVYPPENDVLFHRIAEAGGAVITEYHPGERPNPWHFPERNRIISGMSSGVIVVEAGEKSGALITASMAAEEGRDVFCVPGNINVSTSKGTNALIKNGANLVDDYNDIIFECGWKAKKIKTPIDNYDNLNDTEKTIVGIIIKNGNITIDELCEQTGLNISQLNSTVTMLEISRVIKKLPGNILTI